MLTGYWVNDKWISLTNPFSQDAIRTIVTGIEIVNDDVYVCAYSEVEIDVPSDTETSYSEFTSGYWKNGEWHPLGEEGVQARAFDIVVK